MRTPRFDRPSALTERQSEEIAAFWRDLAPAERRRLSRRASPPVAVMARFEDPEARTDDDDISDFYEYLVNHEVFLEDGRRFHICTAHPAARSAVARGVIDARFECPRGELACPMTTLTGAANGRAVRLRLVALDRCSERANG